MIVPRAMREGKGRGGTWPSSRVRAVYMRGGTSRCLAFHERDLPPAGAERDRILLAALGSPDPYGRQLDGLGGGISSLSKAFIIGAPTHPDAQVDYTFAQVEVSRTVVDYTGNCGNCSSAVGPFAIDERLVPSAPTARPSCASTTPTRRRSSSRACRWRDGEAAVLGDFELPGVAGLGARIALDFLDPGGSRTGRLLPTGRPREIVAGVEASMVDATNPMVFVRAKDLGLTGTETPQAMDGDRALVARLEAIRVAAAADAWASRAARPPRRSRWWRRPPASSRLDGAAYDGRADRRGRARASRWAMPIAPSP